MSEETLANQDFALQALKLAVEYNPQGKPPEWEWGIVGWDPDTLAIQYLQFKPKDSLDLFNQFYAYVHRAAPPEFIIHDLKFAEIRGRDLKKLFSRSARYAIPKMAQIISNGEDGYVLHIQMGSKFDSDPSSDFELDCVLEPIVMHRCREELFGVELDTPDIEHRDNTKLLWDGWLKESDLDELKNLYFESFQKDVKRSERVFFMRDEMKYIRDLSRFFMFRDTTRPALTCTGYITPYNSFVALRPDVKKMYASNLTLNLKPFIKSSRLFGLMKPDFIKTLLSLPKGHNRIYLRVFAARRAFEREGFTREKDWKSISVYNNIICYVDLINKANHPRPWWFRRVYPLWEAALPRHFDFYDAAWETDDGIRTKLYDYIAEKYFSIKANTDLDFSLLTTTKSFLVKVLPKDIGTFETGLKTFLSLIFADDYKPAAYRGMLYIQRIGGVYYLKIAANGSTLGQGPVDLKVDLGRLEEFSDTRTLYNRLKQALPTFDYDTLLPLGGVHVRSIYTLSEQVTRAVNMQKEFDIFITVYPKIDYEPVYKIRSTSLIRFELTPTDEDAFVEIFTFALRSHENWVAEYHNFWT